MPFKPANNAASRLSGALTSSSTTLGVVPGDGAKFPTLSAGDWFPLTIVKADGTLEIVKCTARASDTFTIARAQEGTVGTAFAAGDRVELRLTKASIEELQQKTSDAQAAVSALDTAAVKKTGLTGAAVLPEGTDAQRPATGSIPSGALMVRGNTQDGADYKPEFWDRVAGVWRAFASRPWVQAITDALAARITALEDRPRGLGDGQTWQTVTRSPGVTYTNSTGRPITLMGALNGGSASIGAYISFNGGANIQFIHGSSATGPAGASGSIVIPTGTTYMITLFQTTSSRFYELRTP